MDPLRLGLEKKKLDMAAASGELHGTIANNEKGSLAWNVEIQGPEGTPYSGGNFKVLLTTPKEYQFKPPTVKFLTKTWNPSISESGEEVFLPVLEEWNPGKYIVDVLISLRFLLEDPSPDGAINKEAAEQYQNDKSQFEAKAEEWTKSYASEAGN